VGEITRLTLLETSQLVKQLKVGFGAIRDAHLIDLA
jgi:hypothetical protein